MSEYHDVTAASGGKSTTAMIEQIAKGAGYVTMLTRARIAEALDAFDEGDFANAMNRLDEARNKLSPLVSAQHYLGSFTDEVRVVRAKDLGNYVGCELYGAPKIESVEALDHGDHFCYQVTFEGGDEPSKYRDEQELLIVVASDS